MLYREAGQFKTTYAQDMAMFPIRQDRIALLLLLALAFVGVPLLAKFPALEELHVEQSSITATALAGLKESRSLRLLHIDASQQEVRKDLPGVEVKIE